MKSLLIVCMLFYAAVSAVTDECRPDKAVEDRISCGQQEISKEQCEALSCCYVKTLTQGVPWCFHKDITTTSQCSAVKNRKDCGVYGTDSQECTDLGCCWEPKNGEPWCFQPPPAAAPPYYPYILIGDDEEWSDGESDPTPGISSRETDVPPLGPPATDTTFQSVPPLHPHTKVTTGPSLTSPQQKSPLTQILSLPSLNRATGSHYHQQQQRRILQQPHKQQSYEPKY